MKYESAEPEFEIGDVVRIDLSDCGTIGPGVVSTVRYNEERCFYDVRFIPRRNDAHPTIVANVDEAYVSEYPVSDVNGEWLIGGNTVTLITANGEPSAKRVPTLPAGDSIWLLSDVEAFHEDGIPLMPHGENESGPYWLTRELPDEWIVEDDVAKPPTEDDDE